MPRFIKRLICLCIGHRFPQDHFDLPERLTCQRCGWFDKECADDLYEMFQEAYRRYQRKANERK
jgi:hypothetical protein